jgi:hypothetical protein
MPLLLIPDERLPLGFRGETAGWNGEKAAGRAKGVLVLGTSLSGEILTGRWGIRIKNLTEISRERFSSFALIPKAQPTDF